MKYGGRGGPARRIAAEFAASCGDKTATRGLALPAREPQVACTKKTRSECECTVTTSATPEEVECKPDQPWTVENRRRSMPERVKVEPGRRLRSPLSRRSRCRATLRPLVALALVTAVPQSARANKPIIAVFNIEDRGVGLSPRLLLQLSDYLATQLAASGAYQLVPRDKLKARLSRQKKQSYRRCYTESCRIEIGKELAAQKSLATTIVKLGSKCILSSVVYDLQKAASELGASAEGGCDEDALVAALKELARKLRPTGYAASIVKAPADAAEPRCSSDADCAGEGTCQHGGCVRWTGRSRPMFITGVLVSAAGAASVLVGSIWAAAKPDRVSAHPSHTSGCGFRAARP